jgi:hypothetical protein
MGPEITSPPPVTGSLLNFNQQPTESGQDALFWNGDAPLGTRGLWTMACAAAVPSNPGTVQPGLSKGCDGPLVCASALDRFRLLTNESGEQW